MLAKPFGSDALEGVVLQLLADGRSEEPLPLAEQRRPRSTKRGCAPRLMPVPLRHGA